MLETKKAVPYWYPADGVLRLLSGFTPIKQVLWAASGKEDFRASKFGWMLEPVNERRQMTYFSGHKSGRSGMMSHPGVNFAVDATNLLPSTRQASLSSVSVHSVISTIPMSVLDLRSL